MPAESEFLPLDQQPRLCAPRPWRRRVETVTVIASLLLGGFGLGHVYASRVADGVIARQRDDHQHEIQRLQDAYGVQLKSLTSKVGAAALAAGEAASTAQEAATTAAKAVKEGHKR